MHIYFYMSFMMRAKLRNIYCEKCYKNSRQFIDVKIIMNLDHLIAHT